MIQISTDIYDIASLDFFLRLYFEFKIFLTNHDSLNQTKWLQNKGSISRSSLVLTLPVSFYDM